MTKIQEIEQKLNELKIDFNLQISDLEIKLAELTLAELKESKKDSKKKKWKPEMNENFYYRNSFGIYVSDVMLGNDYDEWRFNNIPIFPTKKECERYWHFMDTVKEKSYSFSKEEWLGYGIRKYFIYYDHRVEQVKVGDEYATKDFNKPYFKTEEDAQYIIDNFKDELMEYFV